MLEPFRNEPLSDFADPARAAAYREALAAVRLRLGGHRPLIIGGETVDAEKKIVSLNPARPAEVVGTVAAATAKEADRALDAAWRAFPGWGTLPAAERAAAIGMLAGEIRRHKFELAAWETLEASKNWVEAEADVAEAIDDAENIQQAAWMNNS
jgi:1-pyrroline-5-carboxylate dehydrogenase